MFCTTMNRAAIPPAHIFLTLLHISDQLCFATSSQHRTHNSNTTSRTTRQLTNENHYTKSHLKIYTTRTTQRTIYRHAQIHNISLASHHNNTCNITSNNIQNITNVQNPPSSYKTTDFQNISTDAEILHSI